jgi:hypothetical protein
MRERATYVRKSRMPLKGSTLAIFTVLNATLGRARGLKLTVHLLPSLVLCLDVLMTREVDIIKEIRYLAGLMRQNCHDASWRVERILSKLEEGESLDMTLASIELSDARKELHLLMRSIEHIERHCDLVSPNDS